MCKQRQITQSYVLLENQTEYTLEYCIFSEPAQNGGDIYGVKIIQRSGDVTTSASAMISSDEECALQTIFNFAKNFVFPVSLRDIMDDMPAHSTK